MRNSLILIVMLFNFNQVFAAIGVDDVLGAIVVPKLLKEILSSGGGEKIVEQSEKERPKWTTDFTILEDTNWFPAVGTAVHFELQDAQTDARQNAAIGVTKTLNENTESSYQRAREETGVPEDNEGYKTAITDVIKMSSNAVLKGLVMRKVYWERLEKKHLTKKYLYYRVWIACQYPKANMGMVMPAVTEILINDVKSKPELTTKTSDGIVELTTKGKSYLDFLNGLKKQFGK